MQKFDKRNSISGIIPDDKTIKERIEINKEQQKPNLREGRPFKVIPGGKLNPQSGEKKG